MTKLTDKIPMEQKISRQFRLWEKTYHKVTVGEKKRILPSLTISYELGSQGNALAQELAKTLGWKLFDKQLVDFIAEHAHVRKNMVEMFDEKTQNEIHTWVFTLLTNHALASDKYFKHLVTVLRIISERGQAIVLGRGAAMILPPATTLRLLIVSPIEKRIEFLAAAENLSTKEATARVVHSDREKQAFIKRFHHVQWENPCNYDITLNLGFLSVQQAHDIVMQALRTKFPDLDDLIIQEEQIRQKINS